MPCRIPLYFPEFIPNVQGEFDMRKIYAKSALVALVVAASLTVAWMPVAQAESGSITEQLQAMVADLSTDQQAALFLLISQLKGGGEAGAAATASAQTDEEKIMATINNVKIALEALDVDKLLDTFSPDFDHPQVGGKDEARAMLTMGLQSGYADNGKVSLDDIELDIDEAAGTATAYPFDLSSPAGAVSVELELQKEADGSWLITTLYVDGI